MSMRSMTYAELGEALKIAPASANRLARRRRWARVPGNDGKVRVAVPEEALVPPARPPDSPPDSPSDSPPVSPPDKLVNALEAHLATVSEQLAVAEARLAAADARLAAADARDAQHTVDLAAERAQTAKAIAAFAALADRLDALAAERARPLWRRLIG